MIKKSLIYLPLITVPAVDQLSKLAIPSLIEIKQLGVLGFEYHLNQNFILGSFESIPLFMKSVVSCSVFLVIFSLVIYIQMLLVPQVAMLRIALNSYFAAMFSNCLDKILYLGVRDFITFDGLIIFNIADVVQWVALPILIFSFFKYSDVLWTPNCLRKSYFMGVRSQMNIVWTFSFLVLTNLIFISFFNYSFLTYIGVDESELYKFLGASSIYIGALFFVSIIFTLVYSQRIVGPVISLLSHIKSAKTIANNYKIRKGDPLVELEEIASLIRKEENDS